MPMPEILDAKKAAPGKGAAANDKRANGEVKIYNFSNPSDQSTEQHPDAGKVAFNLMNQPDDFSKVAVNGADHGGPLSDIARMAFRAVINLDTDIPEAKAVIQVRCGDHLTTFATLKNFTLIIGKAKSKKTFFVVLLLAGFFQGRALHDKIHSITFPGKVRIIVFDTEQADFHVQRTLKRIVAAAGLTSMPDNLEVYCLRPFSTKERRQIIEHVIYSLDDIAVVVIDGIRDLITDINSAEEATMITGLLMKWTHERNIHIINVLHQNKGDQNARGHAGAELTNKAESVLSIAKDLQQPEISIVTPEYFRDREFKPFAFSVDDAELPYVVETWEPSTTQQPGAGAQRRAGKAKDSFFDTIPPEIHKHILKIAFSIDQAPGYEQCWRNIKGAFASEKRPIGDNDVKDFLIEYGIREWVKKEKTGKSHPKYKLTLSD